MEENKINNKINEEEVVNKGDIAIDIQGTSLIGYCCPCGVTSYCMHWRKYLLDNKTTVKILMFRPSDSGQDNLIIHNNISNNLLTSVHSSKVPVNKYIELYKNALSTNKGNSVVDYFSYWNIIRLNDYIKIKDICNNNNNSSFVERTKFAFINSNTSMDINKDMIIADSRCINKTMEILNRITYLINKEYI